MPKRLILIRHGETNFSLANRYCGITDIDLNRNGRKQAKKLKKRLKNIIIEKVYTSDLLRAKNFAELIFKKHRPIALSSLREINFGAFEGLTHDQIMNKNPKIYSRWLKDPFKVTIPKGDNLNLYKRRIIKTVQKIIMHNKNKTVAIVTHAGAIKMLLSNILKDKDIWSPKIGLASLNILKLQKKNWQIESLNDREHLNG